MKKRLYLFDFDGTLTTADTLLRFIRYACGTRRFVAGFALFAPLLVLMKLGLYANWRAKQRLFAWYFRGMEAARFDTLCRRFAADNAGLLRPETIGVLRRAVAGGCTVAVVSASVDNWVRPFFDGMAVGGSPALSVIGTQVETDTAGRLTGRFGTHNCYGPEKVRRVLRHYPDLAPNRQDYTVVAYGDSRGDREMLAFADEGHLIGRRTLSAGRRHIGEIVRFGIVGAAATLIQYGVYWALLHWLAPTAAMTVGYGLSFAFNFVASTRYTFRVEASARRGAGFALSHAVNYVLQMLTLNLFIWFGLDRRLAPVPMFAICVPVNFVLVRFFLTRGATAQGEE